MSQQCNFPINIDTNVKAENCNMYCDYKYDYNDSSCVVFNAGGMLKINYDLKSDGTVSQAFLNKKKYNVSGIQIFQPSKNTYKGTRADIEIVISHEGDNKETLLVSIPFIVSAGSSSSSNLKSGGLVLDNIINEFVKQSAGRTFNEREGYQININNFNLNNFIPNTPYYFFYVNTATCKQSNIVFDMLKSGQTISQTAVDKINKALFDSRLTLTAYYPAVTTQTLYINSNGPNFQGKATDDKIYIDCQPTGEEGKELYKESKDEIGKESKEQGMKLINSLMESGSVQFILAIVLGIIVLGLGKRIFTRT
jgi:carbonic anhydrase